VQLWTPEYNLKDEEKKISSTVVVMIGDMEQE
jgi:hypothetical protein